MTIQNEAQVRTNRPHLRDRPVEQGLETDLSDLDILVNTLRVIYAGYFKSR